MKIHWAAIVLLASCTPGPAPIKEARHHPEFPIDGGHHALGRTTPGDGVIDCKSCHALSAATFAPASCIGCHQHSKAEADPRHASVPSYVYTGASCYRCHPGGTAANSANPPVTIAVGGFEIPQPPAADAGTIQAGVDNLPHSAVVGACTSCHTSASGGRPAFGYDHALAPVTSCAACHEAGSTLVGSPWVLNAPGATMIAAECGIGSGTVADRGGDTRAVGIENLACSSSAASIACGSRNCSLNHFYPTDCGECHLKPADLPASVQTGATYVKRWAFQHFFQPQAKGATCCQCHTGSRCPL